MVGCYLKIAVSSLSGAGELCGGNDFDEDIEDNQSEFQGISEILFCHSFHYLLLEGKEKKSYYGMAFTVYTFENDIYDFFFKIFYFTRNSDCEV